MDNSVKKSGGILWFLTVVVAIALGLFCSVLTVGTLSYFETKEVILKDKNTKQDSDLHADERLLILNRGVKVTFLGFNKSKSPFGDTIDFEIQNHDSKEVTVYFDYLKINGIIVHPVMHERVPAGKTVKAAAIIDTILKEVKIEKIEDLVFQMIVHREDYEKFGEFQIRTNFYGSTDRSALYTNKVLSARQEVEDGEILFSLLPDLTVETGKLPRYYVMIENNTDTPLSFLSSGVIYNGISVKEGGFHPQPLPPRSKSIEAVEIRMPKDIEELIGTDIQSLEVLMDINGHKEVGFRYSVDNVRIKLK